MKVCLSVTIALSFLLAPFNYAYADPPTSYCGGANWGTEETVEEYFFDLPGGPYEIELVTYTCTYNGWVKSRAAIVGPEMA